MAVAVAMAAAPISGDERREGFLLAEVHDSLLLLPPPPLPQPLKNLLITFPRIYYMSRRPSARKRKTL